MICTPGHCINTTQKTTAGPGTYSNQDFVYSSTLGKLEIQQGNTTVISNSSLKIPQINDIVLARVVKINPRFASLVIITRFDSFQAIIRQPDISSTNALVYDSFRPGDIVRALIISFGDQRSYYLSTRENEYGVVMCNGSTQWVPNSWESFIDSVTGDVEKRKVAMIK